MSVRGPAPNTGSRLIDDVSTFKDSLASTALSCLGSITNDRSLLPDHLQLPPSSGLGLTERHPTQLPTKIYRIPNRHGEVQPVPRSRQWRVSLPAARHPGLTTRQDMELHHLFDSPATLCVLRSLLFPAAYPPPAARRV